ncbi:hypothetical protein V2G26_008270 [Clonostachys chloroleuca]
MYVSGRRDVLNLEIDLMSVPPDVALLPPHSELASAPSQSTGVVSIQLPGPLLQRISSGIESPSDPDSPTPTGQGPSTGQQQPAHIPNQACSYLTYRLRALPDC